MSHKTRGVKRNASDALIVPEETKAAPPPSKLAYLDLLRFPRKFKDCPPLPDLAEVHASQDALRLEGHSFYTPESLKATKLQYAKGELESVLWHEWSVPDKLQFKIEKGQTCVNILGDGVPSILIMNAFVQFGSETPFKPSGTAATPAAAAAAPAEPDKEASCPIALRPSPYQSLQMLYGLEHFKETFVKPRLYTMVKETGCVEAWAADAAARLGDEVCEAYEEEPDTYHKDESKWIGLVWDMVKDNPRYISYPVAYLNLKQQAAAKKYGDDERAVMCSLKVPKTRTSKTGEKEPCVYEMVHIESKDPYLSTNIKLSAKQIPNGCYVTSPQTYIRASVVRGVLYFTFNTNICLKLVSWYDTKKHDTNTTAEDFVSAMLGAKVVAHPSITDSSNDPDMAAIHATLAAELERQYTVNTPPV